MEGFVVNDLFIVLIIIFIFFVGNYDGTPPIKTK